MVERQSHQKFSCLRTDRSGEYLSNEFIAYCKLHNIRRQLTTARAPQQNGAAECKNRHLLETMRSLLFGAHLLTYLWEEAVRTANYISNHVPTRTLYHITPYQRYTNLKPNISHLRLFGYASYLHVQTGSKLEPKSKPMTLVGYDETSKAYRCFDHVRHKIVISRDVLFNENIIGIPNLIDSSSHDDDLFQVFLRSNTTQPEPDSSIPAPESSLQVHPISPNLTPLPDTSPPSPPRNLAPTPDSSLIPLCRSTRFRTQNIMLDDYVLTISHEDFDVCLAEPSLEPLGDNLTYAQTRTHFGWRTAMDDEMQSIHKNKTWALVPLPPGKCTITAKWVYKTKPSLHGAAPRLKARLVARGFERRFGIDFEETFAPVVKWSTIRALTTRAAQFSYEIHHLNVKTAFLYGLIKEEVFMQQPQGYALPGHEHLVCRLNRALYGLRQSPRMWYERINTFLLSLGMTWSTCDHNMYHIGTGANKIILVLYIDDLFIMGGATKTITWLKSELHHQFDMTDLGPITRYLGVEFQRHPHGFFLSQRDYVLQMLSDFNMQDCRPEHIPMSPGLPLVTDMDSPYTDPHHYSQIVEKLIFLTTTRPDIAYAVSNVSRYMSSPQHAHLNVVYHILRYLKKIVDYGLLYSRQPKPLV
jgi:hypothetical protein